MSSGIPPIEVDVHSVSQWLNTRNDFVLLDCRENAEYETCKIAGARLVPMSQIQLELGELAKLTDKHIVVHCHHGGRSLRVANWLRQNGFPTAQSMAGGIEAWSNEIDPSVPKY